MSVPLQVGSWRVEPQLNLVVRGEEKVHLEPRAMDLLVYLCTHPGETLSRQRILDAVWGQTAVVDGALSRAVHSLRSALGDEAKQPSYIQTVPRRGYRLIAAVAEARSEAPAQQELEPEPSSSKQRRWPLRPLLLGCALLFALGAALWSAAWRRSEPLRHDPALPHTVQVQSFQDLSPDRSNGPLAVGATETVVSILAGIDGLRVFAPPAPGAAANEVEAALLGTLAVEGEQVRLSARLTRSDGELLWGKVYEAPSSQLLRLQAELATDVAARLGQSVAVPVSWAKAVNPRAYRLYLSGLEHLADRRTDAFVRARQAFNQAVEIAPDFAAAHAGLAETYLLLGDYLAMPETKARPLARQAADRAMELEPSSPEALTAAPMCSWTASGSWRRPRPWLAKPWPRHPGKPKR